MQPNTSYSHPNTPPSIIFTTARENQKIQYNAQQKRVTSFICVTLIWNTGRIPQVMNVTGDFDPDACGKPKFNSTILVPDERSHVQEGVTNTKQNALELSPILKDRVQFAGSNGSPLSRQQYNSEDCSDLQDSYIRAKRMKLEEKTSPLSVLSNSKSAEIDKENMEMTASQSNNASEGSTQLKSNSTARSHITNPFDSDIVGSLCTTTYSPSLFNNSKKNERYQTPEKSFRWSIGQLADFHPVAIDETESMCPTPNPVQEDQINNAVDKFWASQQYVLPSPYFMKRLTNSEQEGSPSEIRRRRTSVQDSPMTFPVSSRFTKSWQSVKVQTAFTFPPSFDLIRLL
ncbi:unnamed protein product, partial [Litomosoides sigmodontis]